MEGVGRTEKKTQTNKRDHPGPSAKRGGWYDADKNARTKLRSPMTQETPQTLTLKFPNTWNNPRRKMKI